MKYNIILMLFFSILSCDAYGQYFSMGLKNNESLIINGSGFVTDRSHPKHPYDFTNYDIKCVLMINPAIGEADIEFSWENKGKMRSDNYYFRRGRIFQVENDSNEVYPSPFGDLSVATISNIHPILLDISLSERRDNIHQYGHNRILFSMNNELWDVKVDSATGLVRQLEQKIYNDLLGDISETISYDNLFSDSNLLFPVKVSVTLQNKETANITFAAPIITAPFKIPDGERKKDRKRMIERSDIIISNIAPNLFSIDLSPTNSRVVVAEFEEFLVILEGAYNSRICDLLAEEVIKQFDKHIEYFSFSHLHAQYLGGVRSWIFRGASVITPPSTASFIENIVSTTHDLYPDNLSSQTAINPELIIVANHYTIKDSTNTLEIYNIESQHTDEYLIFYFPHQKILMSGDLLFYREGKQLKGRSKKFCETVKSLGLDVDTYLATWPLNGYGTKNKVSRAEMSDACGDIKNVNSTE